MSRGPWGEEAMKNKRAEGERAALIVSMLEDMPMEKRRQIDEMADQLVMAMHAIHPKMQFSRLMALETLWAIGHLMSGGAK